jgi:hypothetical protein
VYDPAAVQQRSDVFSFAFHSASGDATNSSVFQQSKLHNLVVQSCYCFEVRRDTEISLLRFGLSREIASDLQYCLDGTGEGAHGMVRKQLSVLGVPLWDAVFFKAITGGVTIFS